MEINKKISENPYAELDRQMSLDRIYLMSLNRLRLLPKETGTWTWGLAIIDKISTTQKTLKESAEIDAKLTEKMDQDPSQASSYSKGIMATGFDIENDEFPFSAISQLAYHRDILPNMSETTLAVVTDRQKFQNLLITDYQYNGLVQIVEGSNIIELTEAGQQALADALSNILD